MNRIDLVKLLRQVSANMDPGHEGVVTETVKRQVDKLIDTGFLEYGEDHQLKLHITSFMPPKELSAEDRCCANCQFNHVMKFSHADHDHHIQLKPMRGVDDGVAQKSSSYYGISVCTNKDSDHFKHLIANSHVCKYWGYAQ